MANNFMITVEDSTESGVQDALKRSGINCMEARESTAIHDGYALTELMIASHLELRDRLRTVRKSRRKQLRPPLVAGTI